MPIHRVPTYLYFFLVFQIISSTVRLFSSWQQPKTRDERNARIVQLAAPPAGPISMPFPFFMQMPLLKLRLKPWLQPSKRFMVTWSISCSSVSLIFALYRCNLRLTFYSGTAKAARAFTYLRVEGKSTELVVFCRVHPALDPGMDSTMTQLFIVKISAN